jgi:hypothetical protein
MKLTIVSLLVLAFASAAWAMDPATTADLARARGMMVTDLKCVDGAECTPIWPSGLSNNCTEDYFPPGIPLCPGQACYTPRWNTFRHNATCSDPAPGWHCNDTLKRACAGWYVGVCSPFNGSIDLYCKHDSVNHGDGNRHYCGQYLP